MIRIILFYILRSQQDSQEFLRYLLQGLHDDINRVKLRRGSTIRRDDYGG